MADSLGQAQSVGEFISKPTAYWHRTQDNLVTDVTTQLPVYVAPAACKLATVTLIMGGAFSAGSATDAALVIRQLSVSGATIHTYSTNFQASWASSQVVLTQPNWSMTPGSYLVCQVDKSGPGVKLPSLAVRFSIDIS